MVTVVILFGLLGPLFWDVTLARVGSSPINLPPVWANPPARFPPAQAAHPLGTESNGRDMLAALITGTPAIVVDRLRRRRHRHFDRHPPGIHWRATWAAGWTPSSARCPTR